MLTKHNKSNILMKTYQNELITLFFASPLSHSVSSHQYKSLLEIHDHVSFVKNPSLCIYHVNDYLIEKFGCSFKMQVILHCMV